MPNVEIKQHSICAGGGHHTLTVSVDGGKDEVLKFSTDELLILESAPLSEALLPMLKREVIAADAKTGLEIKLAVEGKSIIIPAKTDKSAIDKIDSETEVK